MATIRDNIVILQSDHIVNAEYIEGSAVVTQGQPCIKQPIMVLDKGHLTILFRAGRKKTAPVARAFIEASGGIGHMFAPKGGDAGYPKELNFMFGIRTEWKDGSISDLYLGQGSYLRLRNNWWMGAEEVINDSEASLVLASGKTFSLDVISPKTEVGSAEMVLSSSIPPQYVEFLHLVKDVAIKELLEPVNMFTFREAK